MGDGPSDARDEMEAGGFRLSGAKPPRKKEPVKAKEEKAKPLSIAELQCPHCDSTHIQYEVHRNLKECIADARDAYNEEFDYPHKHFMCDRCEHDWSVAIDEEKPKLRYLGPQDIKLHRDLFRRMDNRECLMVAVEVGPEWIVLDEGKSWENLYLEFERSTNGGVTWKRCCK